MNLTIFQFFHWYFPVEGNLWKHCRSEAGRLSSLGISHIWLPPAYKSADGMYEPGYAAYDLYDLGEFRQKGSIRTRYGTKREYLACIAAYQKKKIAVLADIVLNHKLGGDEKEEVLLQQVNEDNRNEPIGGPEIREVHTRFTFPGRKGKYSSFIWDWHCFTGVSETGTVSTIINEWGNGTWEPMLEDEKGNYDYLMGNDIDFRNPHVREELKAWGRWYVETTGVDGFRLDAVKHITPSFYPEWIDHLQEYFKRSFFWIGEYWRQDAGILCQYIDATGGRIQLFDVPLHYHFHEASLSGKDYDMRSILDNTLVKANPVMSVTFVENHDTQPLQALQSPVEEWFKPLAYALILLREQGIPCVFYPDLYGAAYSYNHEGNDTEIVIRPVPHLELMMKIRQLLSYGEQRDYFDHGNVVGWTRAGVEDTPHSGCAVLLSTGDNGEKHMSLGQENAGRVFTEVTGSGFDKITLDDNGEALFRVNAGSIAIWIDEKAGIV